MNKTKIEWCDSTWNPVTGCRHGCEYCYARRIANRFAPFDFADWSDFHIETGLHILKNKVLTECKDGKYRTRVYPYGFEPTLHEYSLDEYKDKKGRTIFVCSMADLFGEWVPDEWIEEVFAACEKAPQHRYLFLTKNPSRYCKLADSDKLPRYNNFWYGSTIDRKGQSIFDGGIHWNTFISIEPLLEPLEVGGIGSFGCTRWIIIGAETGNRKDKVIPEKTWIENITETADITQAAVFMKDSLIPIVGEENMRREFPWEMEQ